MPEHDLEKLLGGFAADTLTPDEKQALYQAALHDQHLFNTLAEEQGLKELLADPQVRRRLVASFVQKSASDARGALFWLNWFRRPTGLAFAGGLTAALFAVVLGTKIYQESLKQAGSSIATEDVVPATPATEPQEKAKGVTEPPALEKKGMIADTMSKRERYAPLSAPGQNAPGTMSDRPKPRSEQNDVPLSGFSKASEEVTGPAEQQPPKHSTQSAIPPTPAPMQAPASTATTDETGPTLSARALFYGGDPARQDGGQERGQIMKPLAESAPPASRERKTDRFALAGKAAGTVARLTHLGLRYSFVNRGTDGRDREMDATAASKSMPPVFLTLEVNQDAYLQVWVTVASSPPKLFLPDEKTGQNSLRTAAGQRQYLLMPTGGGSVSFTARVSRSPFGPITRQEVALVDRLSPLQIKESFSTGDPTGLQEHATYVADQDGSPDVQLSVEIPFSR